MANHLLGKYATAYDAMRKSLKCNRDHPRTLYNIACTACQLGRKVDAIHYLRRAFMQEPGRAERAAEDCDFDNLRTDPEFSWLFSRLLEEYNRGNVDG
jgi:hypothetical protein